MNAAGEGVQTAAKDFLQHAADAVAPVLINPGIYLHTVEHGDKIAGFHQTGTAVIVIILAGALDRHTVDDVSQLTADAANGTVKGGHTGLGSGVIRGHAHAAYIVDMKRVHALVRIFFQHVAEVFIHDVGCGSTLCIRVLNLVKPDVKGSVHKFVGPLNRNLTLQGAAKNGAHIGEHVLHTMVMKEFDVVPRLLKELLMGAVHILAGVGFAGG